MRILPSANIYLGVLLLLLIASFVLGRTTIMSFTPAPVNIPGIDVVPSYVGGVEPRPQRSPERLWRELSDTTVRKFKVTLDAPPARLFVSRTGNTLIVLDQNDSTIKEYSTSGTLIRSISRSPERLPGRIVDFALASDDSVWLAHPNEAIMRMGWNGQVLNRLPDSIRALRLASLHDDVVIAPVPSPARELGEYLFVVATKSGEIVKRIGSLVLDHSRTGLALVGPLVATPDGSSFITAPIASGLVMGYSADGAQRFLRTTIVPNPLAVLKRTPTGATKLPDGSHHVRDITASASHAFVLVDPTNPQTPWNPQNGIIDVYDLRSGDYAWSLRLPFRGGKVAIHDNTLCATERNMVHIFNLDRHNDH